jgi:hypothetical protein
VAQGEGPEFKPQYHKKKENTECHTEFLMKFGIVTFYKEGEKVVLVERMEV